MATSSGMAGAFGEAQIIGMVWYLEKDYPAVLKIMADANLLPLTFKLWQDKAKRSESDLRTTGKVVVRAIIDPATFPTWCFGRGLKIDAKARMAFANDYAYRHGRH